MSEPMDHVVYLRVRAARAKADGLEFDRQVLDGAADEIVDLRRQLAEARARTLRVCKCGGLVSGALDFPCPKCGSVEGELVEMAWWTLQEQLAEAQATIVRLKDAMPPPQRMRLLASWFDMKDRNRGVQDDLRRWADRIEAALAEPKEPTT